MAHISGRPTLSSLPAQSGTPATAEENVRKEQEKWDAWKSNEGLTRTEAKRRYIEKLVATMHEYASNTPEARELVEELEFVWDQIKNNSQHTSSSEHSSPLQHVERSGYLGSGQNSSGPGIPSSAAALEGAGGGDGGRAMRVLSPVSQADEEEMLEEEREEFVDAPVSQVDEGDLQDLSEHTDEEGGVDAGVQAVPNAPSNPSQGDVRWRRRVESSLIKLTTEVAALREQLEFKRFKHRNRHSLLGWIFRLSWWAVELVVADAVLLWVVILYMRRKDDRRLEGAVRVLLGDAVAQVQKVTGREVKIPQLPRIVSARRQT